MKFYVFLTENITSRYEFRINKIIFYNKKLQDKNLK